MVCIKKIRSYKIENKILELGKTAAWPEQLDFTKAQNMEYRWDSYRLSYNHKSYRLRLVDYTGYELHFACFTQLEDGSYHDISHYVHVYQRIYE